MTGPAADGARFVGRFGAAMAVLGVAVGLANIWRFPYMAGQYGGGAFVLVYVFFVLALGVPALIAEWSLGRLTRAGPGGAFRKIGMPGGGLIGGVLFLTVFMAASYYTVVVAQVLFYTVRGGAMADPEAFYAANFSGITPLNLGGTVFVFSAMAVVVGFGVRRGIERLSRIAMPLVGLGLVVVAVRSLTLPGAAEGVRYLLWPDLDRVSATTFLAALGQAFFSLSLGGTFFLAYGSYLPGSVSLRRLAWWTAGGDAGAAILGGLAVIPAAFALGIPPASGPPLLFFTLPRAFDAMPGGAWFGPIFFAALFLAAFLSAVAALEVIVNSATAWCRERAAAGSGTFARWTRGRVIALVVLVQIPLGMPSMVSAVYLGWSDLVWGSTMQPIGSALTLLGLGFFVSRGRALAEAGRGSSRPPGALWLAWIRWVVPAGIVVVLAWGWAGPLAELLS